jgi:geranylgeranylglycerol-phosphate geranylgeranyltransferase
VKFSLSLFALARPLNCLITALSVGVGALTSASALVSLPLLLAALSAALVTGAGNAFNDAIDIDIDRINRPDRPLPAGRLTRRTAFVETLLLGLAGLLLAALISPFHLAVAGGVIGLLITYSIYLKNSVLWGNIAIGIVAAAAFPYGALAVAETGRSWIPAGFALLFHLGREIVKDIEDVEGDRSLGLRTLPLRWGCRTAARVAYVIYLFLIIFTLLPWIAGIYGSLYLGAVLLVDLLLLFALFRLHRQHAALSDDSLGRLLKAGMFLGLAAIVLGELAR